MTSADGAAATPKQPPPLDRQWTFGGETFTLRYSVLAIQALKQVWGFETDKQVVARLNDRQGTDAPEMFFALTRRHHPQLSHEACRNLIDDAASQLGELGRVMGELFYAQSPPAKPKKKDSPGK